MLLTVTEKLYGRRSHQPILTLEGRPYNRSS